MTLQSQPSTDALLHGVTVHLQTLQSQLSGVDGFRNRVAVNVIQMVRRELRLAEQLEDEQVTQISALLGHASAEPEADLSAALLDGRWDLDSPELRACLQDAVGRALLINNPKWLEDAASVAQQVSEKR